MAGAAKHIILRCAASYVLGCTTRYVIGCKHRVALHLAGQQLFTQLSCACSITLVGLVFRGASLGAAGFDHVHLCGRYRAFNSNAGLVLACTALQLAAAATVMLYSCRQAT